MMQNLYHRQGIFLASFRHIFHLDLLESNMTELDTSNNPPI